MRDRAWAVGGVDLTQGLNAGRFRVKAAARPSWDANPCRRNLSTADLASGATLTTGISSNLALRRYGLETPPRAAMRIECGIRQWLRRFAQREHDAEGRRFGHSGSGVDFWTIYVNFGDCWTSRVFGTDAWRSAVA